MRHERHGGMRRMERLSRLGDYQVEKHQIDPRGWNIVSAEGRTLGEVKDLIVDTERMTARYLDAELDSKVFDLRDDPHVLVPIERAHRDGDHRRLVVDGLTVDRVADLEVARQRHHLEFWDSWWNVDRDVDVHAAPSARAAGTRIIRRSADDDLNSVIEDVRPGEEVRIPIVKEEIVVERRRVHPDDQVVARGDDEPPPRRYRDER